MTPEQVFAILLARINKIDAQGIAAAVSEFLDDHPDYFIDYLGLYKDSEGYICQA